MLRDEWLAEPHYQDLLLRVKRGAAWLAERDEAWADKILEAAESDDFCMSDYQTCAVGVVLGDYLDHFDPTAWEEADVHTPAELGFMATSAVGTSGINSEFEALEETWIRVAREQQI